MQGKNVGFPKKESLHLYIKFFWSCVRPQKNKIVHSFFNMTALHRLKKEDFLLFKRLVQRLPVLAAAFKLFYRQALFISAIIRSTYFNFVHF